MAPPAACILPSRFISLFNFSLSSYSHSHCMRLSCLRSYPPISHSLEFIPALSLLYSLAWQGLLIGNKLWEGFQFEVKIASDLPPAVAFLLSFGSVTCLYTAAECRRVKDSSDKLSVDSANWLEIAETWQVNKQTLHKYVQLNIAELKTASEVLLTGLLLYTCQAAT